MTGFKIDRLNNMFAALDRAGVNGMTKKQLRELLSLKSDGGLKYYLDELKAKDLISSQLIQDPSNGRIMCIYWTRDNYHLFSGVVNDMSYIK